MDPRLIPILFPPSYPLRQFTNGVRLPLQVNAANKQQMCRQGVYARAGVSRFKLVFPNFYGLGAELAAGAVASITAAIEYPVGVFTRVLFSGAVTGSIPNGGILTSDFVSLSIPKDGKFYVRTFFESTAAIVFSSNNHGYTGDGDALNAAASGLADQTMGGTVTDIGVKVTYGPCAIVAPVRVNAVALIGDSLTSGTADVADIARDTGSLARSIGPTLPYLNLGVAGQTASNYSSACPNSAALAKAYCNRALIYLGYNDTFGNHVAAATTAANLVTIKDSLGMPSWGGTLTPSTTSTDSWATLGNQTVMSDESKRVALNGLVRGGLSGFAGYFEIANALETAQDSGFWKSPGKTADGVHLSVAGYADVVTAGAINPAVFA